MNKLELSGRIMGGKIKYNSIDWERQFKEFKDKNEDSRISITFEKVDTPRHALFRYYFGYLLPDVTAAAGEISQRMYHLELKKEFLWIPVDGDETKIRAKHSSRCNIYLREKLLDGGEIKYIIDGYTPSCGDITDAEMIEFIERVKGRLFIDLQGCLNPKTQSVADDLYRQGTGKQINDIGEESEFQGDINYGGL